MLSGADLTKAKYTISTYGSPQVQQLIIIIFRYYPCSPVAGDLVRVYYYATVVLLFIY